MIASASFVLARRHIQEHAKSAKRKRHVKTAQPRNVCICSGILASAPASVGECLCGRVLVSTYAKQATLPKSATVLASKSTVTQSIKKTERERERRHWHRTRTHKSTTKKVVAGRPGDEGGVYSFHPSLPCREESAVHNKPCRTCASSTPAAGVSATASMRLWFTHS